MQQKYVVRAVVKNKDEVIFAPPINMHFVGDAVEGLTEAHDYAVHFLSELIEKDEKAVSYEILDINWQRQEADIFYFMDGDNDLAAMFVVDDSLNWETFNAKKE